MSKPTKNLSNKPTKNLSNKSLSNPTNELSDNMIDEVLDTDTMDQIMLILNKPSKYNMIKEMEESYNDLNKLVDELDKYSKSKK